MGRPPLLVLSALLLVLSAFPAAPAETGLDQLYPVIRSLLPQDPQLKQLQEDVSFYYRQSRAGKDPSPLSLYLYRTTEKDTLFTLSSRFNLPYETLATLNHLSRVDQLQPGQLLLVPNAPGLFLPAEPEKDLELFISSWRGAPGEGESYRLMTPRGEEEFIFLRGERFHPIERAYFLTILFRSPLPAGRLTSRYGWRESPISGTIHFHNGIDLAAPRGTEVNPAREGQVVAAGWDDIYGNYVAIRHEGGYTTFYGHLESYLVELNQFVTSTMIIGKVGDTGLSTGPHLHFELRDTKGTFDPESFLSGVER
jgi:murein DD-endopeptidase MepM/ murein hydrolase activator NlpD